MKDLIVSEWRRFRLIALVVAVLHGAVLFLMSRMLDVVQMGVEDHGVMLIIYMLLALVLALMQVGSYRQTSRWLWLIHRPLPPARIFAALALSALALLSLAVLLPLLLFLIATDALSTHVVDVRHYVSLIPALAFTMMAWLAAAHAATSRYKAAVFVLIAPIILAWHVASVWWLLLPVVACVLWLIYIAKHGFRADRFAPIADHRVLLLTALPLQLAFFMLTFQVSKLGVGVVELLGKKPGRTVLQDDASVDMDAYLRGYNQRFIGEGLQQSRDPRAAAWREQLPLLPVAGLQPDMQRFAVRHQFGNVAQPWFDDARNIKWTFSHDRMQFRGTDALTGAPRGWWGAKGVSSAERFTQVPSLNITRNALYHIDAETQQQYELVRLPLGEWFVSRPVNALDRMLLLTNKRVLAYHAVDARAEHAPPQFDWQVTFDDTAPPALSVLVAELMDGWLLSFFYSDSREFNGFEKLTEKWQQVVFVDTDGSARIVGERRNIRNANVSFGSPPSVPLSSWWVSPPLYALAHVPDLLDTGLTLPPRFEALPRVPVFWALALTAIVASIVCGYVWLRGTQVTAPRRRLWLASCALLGLPALFSMLCLEPRRATCR